MPGKTKSRLRQRIIAEICIFRRRKLLAFVVVCFSVTLGYHFLGSVKSTDPSVHNEQKVYEFVVPNHPLNFLEKVDVTKDLRPMGYESLDQTHRDAKIHTGNWVHVIDGTGNKILLLKRGPQLMTCPNSWGLVGEHTNGDELPLATTERALVEELWGGNARMQELAFVRNLTEHPLMYLRDYPNQRIDHQVTYMYEARFKEPSDKIQLVLDDEVFEHRWVTLDEYQQWLKSDTADSDFCHATIVQLNQLGLDRLLLLRNQKGI